MEWSKVKNIIILLLILVNGFLLVLVVGRRSQVNKYQRAALTQAIQVLEENGIQAEEKNLSSLEDMSLFSVARDLEAEKRAVQALLGEDAQQEDRGGGLYLYSSGLGEVSFRSGGEFSAFCSDDSRWEADDPAKHGAELLESMGAQVELVDRQESGREERLVYCQRWEDASLFSCQVTLTYREGRLTELWGSLLFSGQSTGHQKDLITLPTALSRFLDYILDSGDVCSDITAMEAGYQASMALDGTAQLTPVWRVATNTALYYLNGVTGEVSRISSD